jgi:hypothetical protein
MDPNLWIRLNFVHEGICDPYNDMFFLQHSKNIGFLGSTGVDNKRVYIFMLVS